MSKFRKFCFSFNRTLLLITVTALSGAIAMPAFLALLLNRLFVLIIAKSFRRDLHSFVPGLKALFVAESPEKSLAVILTGFVIQGEISSERIRQLFQERVLNLQDADGNLVYEELQYSWTHFMGYAFWKRDSKFLLTNHVRDYDYEGELFLSKQCSPQDLQRIWPKLAEAPWRIGESPWEMLVVQNYLQPAKTQPHTLIIFRIDHIHCDVYSIIGMVRNLFQSPFKTPKPGRNTRPLSLWERANALLKLPHEIAKINSILLKGRKIGERTGANNTYCSISSNVSLDVIKSIKQKHNVEFATVIQSAIDGAIARALKSAGRHPPSNLDLSYVLPLPNHPGGWNLHATMVLAELPCNARSSTERLYQTENKFKKLETSLAPISFTNIFLLLALAPSTIVRPFLANLNKLGPSCYISNFPTTLSKEYVDGLEIVDVFTALTISESVGLVITSWGVNNQQRLNFLLDKSIFGEETSAIKIATYFEEELEDLRRDGQNVANLLSL